MFRRERREKEDNATVDVYAGIADAIWQQLNLDPHTLHSIANEIALQEYDKPRTLQVLDRPGKWELQLWEQMGYGPKFGAKEPLFINQLQMHAVTPMGIAAILLQNVSNMPELFQQMSGPLVQPEIAFYELAARLAPFIHAALGEHYVYPQIYTPLLAVSSSPRWGRARRRGKQ